MKRLLFLIAIFTVACSYGQTPSLPVTTANNLRITNPVQGALTDSVLVWRGTGDKIARWVKISDIVAEAAGGEFIPLSGTTEGNPVTGNVEMADGTNITANDGGFAVVGSNGKGVYLSSFQEPEIKGVGGRGLISNEDYTANITDLDYTQKKYVDSFFQEYPETIYAQTITFGGTSPSGTMVGNWRATRVGKHVTVRINIYYPTPGTSNTSATIPLPTGLPTPSAVTGFNGTDNHVTLCQASMYSSLTGDLPTQGRATLKKTTTGHEIRIMQTSLNATGVLVLLDYWID